MTVPVYVVIPVRDRHEMLANLVAQLVPQNPAAIFVFDNESDPPQPHLPGVYVLWSPERTVFQMWNAGLDLAEASARYRRHDRWNVAILNSDITVAPNFLATLAEGLRSQPDAAIAYPNEYGLSDKYGPLVQFENLDYARQTFTGWAFMVPGELGFRFDEQFDHWYADSDYEMQVRHDGHSVVSVVACPPVPNLCASGHIGDPGRLEQIHADEAKFAAKWGIDPATLFLAQNPEFGTKLEATR